MHPQNTHALHETHMHTWGGGGANTDTFTHTVYKPRVQNTQAEMHCKKRKKKISTCVSRIWFSAHPFDPSCGGQWHCSIHMVKYFFLWMGGYYRRGRGSWLNKQNERGTEDRVMGYREKNCTVHLALRLSWCHNKHFENRNQCIRRDSSCLRLSPRLHAPAALFVWKTALRMIPRKFQTTRHLLRARLWMWFDFTAVQHSHHKATPENSSLGGARCLPFSFYEVQQNTRLRLTGLMLARRHEGLRVVTLVRPSIHSFQHFTAPEKWRYLKIIYVYVRLTVLNILAFLHTRYRKTNSVHSLYICRAYSGKKALQSSIINDNWLHERPDLYLLPY